MCRKVTERTSKNKKVTTVLDTKIKILLITNLQDFNKCLINVQNSCHETNHQFGIKEKQGGRRTEFKE